MRPDLNPTPGLNSLNGVADGTRTHDNRNHNPGLYQLSYSHHRGTGTQARAAPENTTAL